jgi:hypothetical protein
VELYLYSPAYLHGMDRDNYTFIIMLLLSVIFSNYLSIIDTGEHLSGKQSGGSSHKTIDLELKVTTNEK